MIREAFNEYIETISKKYLKLKRILFVNPFQFNPESFDLQIAEKRGYYLYPPAGLLFLSASLIEMNIEVDILDLNYSVIRQAVSEKKYDENGWKKILDRKISEFKPSVVGVTCMFSNLCNIYENILQFLMKKDSLIVIAGGTHVSFEYEDILRENLCHFAFVKDSETKIKYFADLLFKSGKNSDPQCEIFCLSDGRLVESSGIKALPEVEIDIRKAYELIPVEDYCKTGSLNQFSRISGYDIPFATVSMNRGCRGSCTFCSVRSLLGKKIRSRSTDLIILELKYLTKRGIKHFDWLDDDLLADREKCVELFSMMVKEDLNIKWYANNGLIAATMDAELLRLMRDSGCVGFKLGIESGNEEMLKKIRKPATIQKLLKASELFSSFPEMISAGNYIIGFPEERYSQMLDTFIFANEMNLDWSGFYICQPLKGSVAFDSFDSLGDERCRKGRIDNYMPVKKDRYGSVKTSRGILKGLDVFSIKGDSMVSREQLEEVWFTFGLVTNFINNKNLKPGGNVEKFIKWVEVAMSAYPFDASMALFLYIGYIVNDNKKKASEYLEKTLDLYEKSPYWKERFRQFELDSVIKNNMKDKMEVFDMLDKKIRDIEVLSGSKR